MLESTLRVEFAVGMSIPQSDENEDDSGGQKENEHTNPFHTRNKMWRMQTISHGAEVSFSRPDSEDNDGDDDREKEAIAEDRKKEDSAVRRDDGSKQDVVREGVRRGLFDGRTDHFE